MSRLNLMTVESVKRTLFALTFSALFVGISAPLLGAEGGEDLESVRATLAKWMETQQIISKEERDWQVGKEVLQQRIDLIRGEISTLDARIEQTRKSISEADGKRGEMIRENEALKAASASLRAAIGALERRTLSMLGSVPDPVRERVKPLSQRIPSDPANTTLSLSERFQNVIGILNELNKFSQEITITSEIRTLSGGDRAEVKALYLGLAQAYYVTPRGDRAGIGRSTAEGWSWTESDHLADEIARAIAIVQNEEVPAYVPLPVTIE
jgi:hypothetical protein